MRNIKKDKILAILLISPSILAMLVFIYGFIGFTGYASLSNWKIVESWTSLLWGWKTMSVCLRIRALSLISRIH